MKRKAMANWQGGLKTGRGSISTDSRVLLNSPYSFGSRFEQAPGTNPEELVAAAHAACFSMAFSLELEKAGFPPSDVRTEAAATLEKLNDGWRVTAIHLETDADVPGIAEAQFQKIAEDAKRNCPISRLLNANITLNAILKRKAA